MPSQILDKQNEQVELRFVEPLYQKETISLPVLRGTMGPPVIDIRKLYQETGYFTYDPGYTSTASCSSKITFIDGEQGSLLYRGYPIKEVAESNTFLKVAYLLMEGELPSSEKFVEFEKNITFHTMIHEQLRNFFSGFRRDAHPMAVMIGVVGALSAFYHDSLDIRDPEQRKLASYRLIAKMPTIAAMAYKYSIGKPFMYPQNELEYTENFLYMMFATPSMPYQINPIVAKALDKLLILHADHEQNASTSTVRMVGSSGVNPFACIAAGIACLWGQAHGGANEAVLNMLKEIGHKDRIPEFIKRAKDKDDPFRLMGFGHRVYKHYDPRAAVLKKASEELLEELGFNNDPLLILAKELEKVALKDPYFVEKKLYPNIDFYSGFILKAIGVPLSMFTVIFAVARTAGWIAHWLEMIEGPEYKIGRPRQLYTGHTLRNFNKPDGA